MMQCNDQLDMMQCNNNPHSTPLTIHHSPPSPTSCPWPKPDHDTMMNTHPPPSTTSHLHMSMAQTTHQNHIIWTYGMFFSKHFNCFSMSNTSLLSLSSMTGCNNDVHLPPFTTSPPHVYGPNNASNRIIWAYGMFFSKCFNCFSMSNISLLLLSSMMGCNDDVHPPSSTTSHLHMCMAQNSKCHVKSCCLGLVCFF